MDSSRYAAGLETCFIFPPKKVPLMLEPGDFASDFSCFNNYRKERSWENEPEN